MDFASTASNYHFIYLTHRKPLIICRLWRFSEAVDCKANTSI